MIAGSDALIFSAYHRVRRTVIAGTVSSASATWRSSATMLLYDEDSEEDADNEPGSPIEKSIVIRLG